MLVQLDLKPEDKIHFVCFPPTKFKNPDISQIWNSSIHFHPTYQKYYSLKPNATQLRRTFLDYLVNSIIQELGISLDEDEAKQKRMGIIKDIKHREGVRQMFRNIRRVLGKYNDCNLRTVVGVNQNGKFEATSKAHVKEVCIQEANRRFTQARHTPFYSIPFLQDFGYTGYKQSIREVLAGSYVV